MTEPKVASRIAIVVPAYNEQDNVDRLYAEVSRVLDKQPIKNWKIIFIDDGSTDRTLEKIQSLTKNGNVEYISFSKNYGHQVALKAGMDHLAEGYDFAITMDCDLQHPPKMIPELIKKWQSGWDVIYTVRESTDNVGILKNLTSTLFYKIFRRLTGIKLEEGAADFRLYDKKVLRALGRYTESSLFLRGIVASLGFKQTSVPYKAGARVAGQSTYSYKKMFKLAADGVTSFSTVPLRIAAFTGFLFSALAAIYGVYALLIWLFSSNVVPGWASITAGFCFLGGLQLMFIGIIGIYVGRVFEESKSRPLYLISETNIREPKL